MLKTKKRMTIREWADKIVNSKGLKRSKTDKEIPVRKPCKTIKEWSKTSGGR